MEHTITDHLSGQIVTHDLKKYIVPVNADVPAIDAIIIPEGFAQKLYLCAARWANFGHAWPTPSSLAGHQEQTAANN